MGDGACLWSDELKISQPVQHTAIRPKKKKRRKAASKPRFLGIENYANYNLFLIILFLMRRGIIS
jgi:hypothetical protein